MKRGGAVLTVLFLLFALLPARGQAVSYSDTEHHWAAPAIERWSACGIISGWDDSFRPDAPITRAELSALLNRLLGYQYAAKNTFFDLPDGAWYTDAMLRTARAGVIAGSGGALRPNDRLTRQEAAVILGRALAVLPANGGNASAFSDADEIASWAAGYVSAMESAGYLTGNDGLFRPLGEITRAEVATVLDRMVGVYYAAPGMYIPEHKSGIAVIAASGVTVQDAALPADLLIAPAVGDGEVLIDNVTVSGRIAVKGGGPGAVLLRDVGCAGGVAVARDGAWVWVAAEGDCRLSVTAYGGGATIVTRDLDSRAAVSVKVLDHFSTDEVLVLDGDFTTVICDAANAQVVADGTIEELILLRPADVTGDAAIAKQS